MKFIGTNGGNRRKAKEKLKKKCKRKKRHTDLVSNPKDFARRPR
jgi:hypothetical protein